MQAARCALRLKERWPEARVALASGRSVLRGHLPLGEAADRAGRLVHAGMATSFIRPLQAGHWPATQRNHVVVRRAERIWGAGPAACVFRRGAASPGDARSPGRCRLPAGPCPPTHAAAPIATSAARGRDGSSAWHASCTRQGQRVEMTRLYKRFEAPPARGVTSAFLAAEQATFMSK
ncbi:hypothetical protein [Sorangium sp. So ce1099]|uniref:hypothetical protein n=1 Tax=Sorangium sp. So ce1099 TaxID=3133331 RepID=UPI003F5FDE76